MKRRKSPHDGSRRSDLFDALPDDLVITILSKLFSSASSPSDFVSLLLTCKRLNRLGLHPLVLSHAGPGALSIRAHNWSDDSHRFLKLCATAGNAEASYILGMIRFYCLQNWGSGASLMAKAAKKSHAPALYSLAVIQFNGSGGSKSNKNLRAGVALCARAAYLGHVDALRELGHCLQDGYGIRRNVVEGRRLLVQANAREVECVLRKFKPPPPQPAATGPPRMTAIGGADREGGREFGCQLWSDFGCEVPERETHPANRFMAEWFGSRVVGRGNGMRMCSHSGCGRPETRKNEFRRCSGCGRVNYCSRGCQAHDWKVRHKVACAPLHQWIDDGGPDDQDDDGDDLDIGDEWVGPA